MPQPTDSRVLHPSIGKVDRVPLREVWRHEALDFTKWLESNPEVLEEALGFNLASIDREQSAGSFSVDLLAEDASGNTIIIENQLEKSDHDHLGKVLTYLAALEAKAAVWIVAEARPEHVGAISWLNDSSSASFYLLKVEAIRIGSSLPAPLLTKIVGPSEDAGVQPQKQHLAERHKLRHAFWSDLLERAKTKTNLHANISPSHSNWIGAGAGKSGLAFNYVVGQREARVELYIDRGKERGEENQEIFDRLKAQKEKIEESFEGPLEWDALEGRRACRISKRFASGGYKDEENWTEIHDELIDAMVRLEQAFAPYIEDLDV